MKQRLLKYKSNRSWGDTRSEAFYWAVIRNKSFGSILEPSDFDASEYLSVEETNAFIKKMLSDRCISSGDQQWTSCNFEENNND